MHSAVEHMTPSQFGRNKNPEKQRKVPIVQTVKCMQPRAILTLFRESLIKKCFLHSATVHQILPLKDSSMYCVDIFKISSNGLQASEIIHGNANASVCWQSCFFLIKSNYYTMSPCSSYPQHFIVGHQQLSDV